MITVKAQAKKTSKLGSSGLDRYKVDLPAQQADCEVSYQYLLCLLQQAQGLSEGAERSYVLGNDASHESIMRLTVVEQTKYTSLVHIVHYCQLQKATGCGTSGFVFPSQKKLNEGGYFDGLSYRGDVRLYHDADMAEVVKCQRYRHFLPRYEYPNIDMHQINEKAQMNRFLRDILAYCLVNGRVAEPVITRSGLVGHI